MKKKSLIKIVETSIFLHQADVQILERFNKLMKYISDVPKSETFVYLTKITAVTWSINKILPVSIALSFGAWESQDPNIKFGPMAWFWPVH